MRRTSLTAIAFAVALMTGATAKTPASISDPARPAEDVARDAMRKPAEMLALSGIRAGDNVLELLPGGGYFTRIFSKEIGPTGPLFGAVPDPKGSYAEPAAAA